MSRNATRPPAWQDATWVTIGERLVYARRPTGEKCTGYPNKSGEVVWLLGGATGIVTEGPSGGYARMRCPNHDKGTDDCICGGPDEDGNDDGWLREHAMSAVVAWTLEDGTLHTSLIRRDEEGDVWERA